MEAPTLTADLSFLVAVISFVPENVFFESCNDILLLWATFDL